MAHGNSPYDYLDHEFQGVLQDALEQVPEARRHLDQGRIPSARKALEDAGFEEVSGRLELSMPYMFSV